MKHLLLLHGAIGSAHQFAALQEQLQQQYIVHTLNFNGHGGCAFANAFGIAAFAEEVINYLDEHQIDKAHIFGYSMGGYVALYAAHQYPDRIDQIFTFATKFLWTPEIAEKEIKMLNSDKIQEKLPAFAQHLMNIHGEENWRTLLAKTAEMMIALGQHNPLTHNDIATIQHRVLLGIGDRDTMVSLQETVDMYRALPNAQLLVLPNTPHPYDRIHLDALVEQLKRFF